MMSATSVDQACITQEITDLLRKVAEIKQIKNSEIIFDVNAIKGDGFLGEFFLGSVKNKDTNETHDIAIKKAFTAEAKRAETNMHLVYKNEIYFYTNVFPAYKQFQKERNVKKPFNNVAEFILGELEEPKETLIMGNLKTQGYQIRNPQELLDEEHAKRVLKIYGKFHALSFALKDQHPEKYREVAGGTNDVLMKMMENKETQHLLDSICENALEFLDKEEEKDVIKASEKSLKNASATFQKLGHYKGDYDVIDHGDCWTSNQMYRYSSNGALEDIKLIDFQLMRVGTTVYDLSYFFYTSGSKLLFDKLEVFLKVYHESLSEFLRELGSDPEKIYPYQKLKEEWKNYALFGVILSLLLVKLKLLEKGDAVNLVESETNAAGMLNAKVDEQLLKQRSRDILLSAYREGLRGINCS